MHWFMRTITEWTAEWDTVNETLQFLTQHGTALLFGVVLAEQLGVPLPAMPLLVAAGALVGTGHMNPWTALAATVFATLLADGVWYELGRRRGRQVLDWLCRIALEPSSCVRRTEAFFAEHGARSLVLAKFVPGLSTIAPPLAGVVGLGLPLFLLYDGIGAMIWVGSGLGLGYAFSNQFEAALAYAEQVAPTVTIGMIATLMLYLAHKLLVRRRQLRGVPRLTVDQVRARLTMDEPPLLIDVRPKELRQTERGIPDSLWMSLDEMPHRHHELPRHRDLVLYCGCPADAASAEGALLLRKKGFTRVWPLAGGIEAWRAFDGPAQHTVPLSGQTLQVC